MGLNNQHIDSGCGLFDEQTTTEFFGMNGFGDNHQSHVSNAVKERDYKDATDLAISNSYGIDEEVNGYTENSGCLKSKKSGGNQHSVAYSIQTSQVNQNGSHINEEVNPTLNKNDKHAVSYSFNYHVGAGAGNIGYGDISPTLNTEKPPALHAATIVRRLTPKEAGRLQGFPDGYLDILFNGKPASDRHKYAAFGNSMAVPVMKWLGERIDLVDKLLKQHAHTHAL